MGSSVIHANAMIRPEKPPPAAPGSPLRNAVTLFRNPLPLFVDLYQKLGPIFRLPVPGRGYIVIAGPEATNFLKLHDGKTLSSQEIFGRAAQELRQADHFISAVDGEEHTRQRGFLQPGFAREFVERNYIQRMLQAAEQVLHTWQPGQRLRMKATIQVLVGQQLGFAMTGSPIGSHVNDVVTYIQTLDGAAIAKIWPSVMLHLPSYLIAKKRVEAWMLQIIQERRANGQREDGPDLLDVMLAARNDQGQPLSDIDVTVGIQLPYMAGMEVANVVTCLIYELLKHPEVLEQATDEVDRAFSGGIPDAEAFGKMPVLHGAVLEALRLHPIFPAVPRVATEAIEFQDYPTQEGQWILFSTTASHFLPNLFPGPCNFDVARYTPPRNEHRQSGAFTPFASGPHTCIGQHVSRAVMVTTAAMVLRMVRLALDPPDYLLRTTMAPLIGPEKKFSVRVLEQRRHAA